MAEASKILRLLEQLWAFLPGGKVQLAALDPAGLNEAQALQLRLYRDALMGMTGALFVPLLHPRVWTLALALPIFIGCFYYRTRTHRALTADLGEKLPPPVG